MRVLDLFSGIGGFSLGLERAGMRTVAFCEIDPYARAVLRKHWPNVPCYDDVRSLTADQLKADGIVPDVICGGFPCQDISLAGKGAGIEGERSGLWSEYARIIGDIRPAYVIVENVAALLGRGLERVLGDLAALGYDAEWNCIPASAVGAPHRRDRLWIIAYRQGHGWRQGDAHGGRLLERMAAWSEPGLVYGGEAMANTNSERGRRGQAWGQDAEDAGQPPGHPEHRQWDFEPNVGRVANGVSNRVDRLRAIGNAVVPQIPQIIGEAIMFYEQKSR